MCGRFTQRYSWQEVYDAMNLTPTVPRNLRARYNIAPTTQIDVVRTGAEGEREITSMRWGLVPGWHKGSLKDFKAMTINARVEGVETSGMFKGAFKARRCIIPASGFFEWTGPKTDRQPHYFSAADGAPVLAFAALWERWRNPEMGEPMDSATIITVPNSVWMGKYHDRMPAILEPDAVKAWLSGSAGSDVLQPSHEEKLREWLVDKRVNKAGVGDDDPETIAAIG